ncbi:MAG TPA: hypothetical protein PKE40_05105 [Arachnia sp.]|nr:hypothetical protein [Arachnia sp.]HMT85712.1 hypothetical protein [Arachnia sp.]
MTIELFPIDIGKYDRHAQLDVEAEVEKITASLAEFGISHVERPWEIAMADRGHKAVSDRLSLWETGAKKHTILYWVGHGEETALAHSGSSNPIRQDGITPDRLADAIQGWYLHSDETDWRDSHEADWLFVIIDACRTGPFVAKLVEALERLLNGQRPRIAVLATSDVSSTTLGSLSAALDKTLRSTFLGDRTIRIDQLANELDRILSGKYRRLNLPVDAVLTRLNPIPEGFQGSLDVRTELERLLRELPEDEQRHFLPKAQGGELSCRAIGEVAWYFTGRGGERQEVLRGLKQGGMTVVTGRAGAGKSALLGDILVRSRPQLAEFLIARGLLAPIADPTPPPFDAAIHLSGMPNASILTEFCEALGVAAVPGASLEEQLGALEAARASGAEPRRLMVDALDEAIDPIWVAGAIRPIAKSPGVTLLVGTRRSTREGPDQPDTDDSTLLDALGDATPVTLKRDPDAALAYAWTRLRVAEIDGDTDGELSKAAAEAIASVNQEFLYVHLATYELLRQPELLKRDVVAKLGTTHGELFARAVKRLTAENSEFYPLIAALATAQARGLPVLDGVWATVAAAIADRPITAESVAQFDAAIPDLLDAASPYLALDREHDQTVYRLAHRTFVEHFSQHRRQWRAWHQAIVRAAIATIEKEPDVL